ncbi:hypothetical protein Cantr_00870 [Candida viswanathii]|uniref:Uncharacterized protein n=1 Tax=Candida viswanathii TaxID=5486 RepID=A0A367YH28_9ASCO|nr:hypothetical protein Cantr_00870 [Candida viswanathii]
MLRIFRVDHQKEISPPDPRYLYIDVTKDTNIKHEHINKEVPTMKNKEIPLYSDNYVLRKDNGLLMKSIRNNAELEVDATELPKAFYGYYENKHVPVVVFYRSDEEVEFLKSKNQAARVKYEFFDDDKVIPMPWYTMPGENMMVRSYVFAYLGAIWDKPNVSRMYYFTEDERLYCANAGIKHGAIEVESILDASQPNYDIAEKVYKFAILKDIQLDVARITNKRLVEHVGVPLLFLGRTLSEVYFADNPGGSWE